MHALIPRLLHFNGQGIMVQEFDVEFFLLNPIKAICLITYIGLIYL